MGVHIKMHCACIYMIYNYETRRELDYCTHVYTACMQHTGRIYQQIKSCDFIRRY